MSRRVRCYFALSRTEHRLVMEAAVLVMLVAAGLRLGRLSTLRSALAFCARPSRRRAPAGARAVAWAVTAVARRLPGCDTCLVKALTTDVMLRRRELPSTFRLGVRPPRPGTLVAHAWVESGGDVVSGALDDLAAYRVLSGRQLP